MASITAVGKSFDRRVGVAMGVYSVLLSVLFAAAFIAVGNSVRVNGWRTAWAQVAFGLLLFAAPVTLLLRERLARGTTGRRRPGGVRSVAGGRAPHAGVLGVCRRDLAVRAGVVRVGTVQRGRARRTRFRSADLRQLSGRDVDHCPGRPAGLRLADPAMVDAAAARRRDVPLCGGAGRAAVAADAAASLGLRGADRPLRRYDHGHLLRGVAAGIRLVRISAGSRARRRC